MGFDGARGTFAERLGQAFEFKLRVEVQKAPGEQALLEYPSAGEERVRFKLVHCVTSKSVVRVSVPNVDFVRLARSSSTRKEFRHTSVRWCSEQASLNAVGKRGCECEIGVFIDLRHL